MLSQGPKITSICSTASAQHPSMCTSTALNTLWFWSDIQLSAHKTEHYGLWQGRWCHHTQARLWSWQKSSNWKFLTLTYRERAFDFLFLWNNEFKKLKTTLFSEVSWNNAGLMFKLHNWWDLWDSYSILLLRTVRADWQTTVTLWLPTSSWTSVLYRHQLKKNVALHLCGICAPKVGPTITLP